MNNIDVIRELQHSRVKEILESFTISKTPGQVEKELGIKKLKLKQLVDVHFLKPLNPKARKGRLYILTNKSRQLLGLSKLHRKKNNDWNLIGWVLASPRQRLVALKAMDSHKRTSEEIRRRAERYNSHLTRISTKSLLKELLMEELTETEMQGRKRYYWITERGKEILNVVLEYEKGKNI